MMNLLIRSLFTILLLLAATSAWAAEGSIDTASPTGKLRTLTTTTSEGTVNQQAVVWCDGTGACVTITSGTGGSGVPVVEQNPNRGAYSNNATDPTDKIATLPCVVKAASPSWTGDRVVPCRVLADGSLVVAAIESGDSTHRRHSTADNNLVSITGTGTVVYHADCLNHSTTVAGLLRIYNKATAPVVATDAGLIVFKQTIPAADSVIKPGGFSLDFGPNGIGSTTSGFGISITGVTAVADLTDTATTNAPADILCNFRYTPKTN